MNLFPDEKSSHCGAASLPTTTAPRADPWVHGPQRETLLPVVAFLSETFCDGASVHARNPRHVVPKSAMRTVSTCFSGALLRPLLFKPLRQALYGGIVGCREGVLRHYDCHGIDPRSLEIPATRKIRSAQAEQGSSLLRGPWYPLFVLVVGWHAIISHDWIGQHKDLAFKGIIQ